MAREDIGEVELTYDAQPRLWPLMRSDYAAAHPGSPDPSSPAGLLRLVSRYLINPSLQLAFLVRLAQCGPQALQHPIRWLQVVLFSSEIYWFRGDRDRIRMGPGIYFPHPINIIIGGGSAIGTGVAIYNNTQIGTDRGTQSPEHEWDRSPAIGDRATVYAYTTLQGPHVLGHDAKAGINVVLAGDVPPGAHQTMTKLRPARRRDAAE